MDKYDAIIVGAGPSGIFAAYELITKKPDLKILMIEKGKPIEDRFCPVVSRKIGCTNCKPCNILSGWGGAGAFSDGKLTHSDTVGGNLSEQIIKQYMVYVDDIYTEFGADKKTYGPDDATLNDYSKRAFINNLKLYPFRVRHMGTEYSYAVLKDIYKFIVNKGVEVKFLETVNEIMIEESEKIIGTCGVLRINEGSKKIYGIKTDKGSYNTDKIILAPGREGSNWLVKEMKRIGINTTRNYVDIGVRMEIPSDVMSEIIPQFYELKLEYYSKTFNDRVRTFCMCPDGEVIMENYNGLMTVNGHSYKGRKTGNTNFAILVSTSFTEPFDQPLEYAKSITSLSNMLSNGVIVQMLGDLKRGRRSTAKRLEKGFVKPSLSAAVPGDISFVLPYRYVVNILEMIGVMDKMIPGVGSDHNLLYAVEAKFYSAKIDVNDDFQTPIKGLYAIGDGAGLTRGLMQSSISGVHVANQILSKKG